MFRNALILILFFWPTVSFSEGLPTAESTDAIMKQCAIGRTIGVEAEVKAGLQRFLKGAEGTGSVKMSDLGGILDKIGADATGVEMYKLYVSCLKAQTELKLQELNIKIDDRLSKINKRVNAQPIPFPKSPFQGNMFVKSIKVGRTYDTVVRIFDATCNVWTWLPMWKFPKDRSDEPLMKVAMTDSGKTAEDFPFELRFDRDSQLVNDAGEATKEFSQEDSSLEGFSEYALSAPDEIRVYLALRGDKDDCSGTYSVEYEPKKN